MIRHQWAGHVTASEATNARPGRILPAAQFGEALQETGLWDSERFLQRVQEELVPVVEGIRDEVGRRFPDAERFATVTYPTELGNAAEGR
jgi:hypothetical protein